VVVHNNFINFFWRINKLIILFAQEGKEAKTKTITWL
jgi:hypothetical protein